MTRGSVSSITTEREEEVRYKMCWLLMTTFQYTPFMVSALMLLLLSAVAPVSLEILEKPTYVSEGKEREVTCQAVGGFPSPTIQWWIGTKNLQPSYQVLGQRQATSQVVGHLQLSYYVLGHL
jgi:hypothetical protein